VRKALAAFLLLVAAACGGPPTAAATPTPSEAAASPAASPSPVAASPTPRPTGLLFAVLETHAASGWWFNDDTVAIVGLDGFARAKQRFMPRTLPANCNAGVLTQLEARVAAGKVFYFDGSGTVRSLDPGGTIGQVTTFPVAAHQVLSVAVDPSGTQLLGARVTYPTFSTSGLPCTQTGNYAMELLSAPAGGNAQLVYHQTYAQQSDTSNFMHAVGWDPAGAEITVHTSIGTQNGTLGQKWYGQLAHWTPQGIGSVVGGPDCRAQDAVGNSIACISNSGEGAGSVRGPDASIQWNLPSAIYYFIVLSPDATRAAYCNSSECGVAGKDGSHLRLPAHFSPTGWLDSTTLIGVDQQLAPYGEMETVSLGDPTKVDDLGFKGSFVGVVQAS
jgi:hypothetical protein